MERVTVGRAGPATSLWGAGAGGLAGVAVATGSARLERLDAAARTTELERHRPPASPSWLERHSAGPGWLAGCWPSGRPGRFRSGPGWLERFRAVIGVRGAERFRARARRLERLRAGTT